MRNKDKGLFDYLLESRAASFLILTNCAFFFYVHFTATGASRVNAMILYPGNLLQGKIWCLVTSGFIHSDWTHLFLNILGIFIFARIVERSLGVTKTLYIYFGSLAISMLFATGIYAFAFQKSVAIIGASGAVMGLLAAALLLDPLCITYEMILPIPIMFKGWLFLYADLKGFLGGEGDGVSHLAHLCGFLSVAVLVYFLSKKERTQMRIGLVTNIASFVFFLVLSKFFLAP